MFVILLAVTLAVSFAVSAMVMWVFTKPIDSILRRIIADEISIAWAKYLRFAILVVGVSAGVRIYDLEKYITAPPWNQEAHVVALTWERWILEIYRTVIETLQGVAWLLLVFYVFALIGFVIVRRGEIRREKQA